MRPFWTVSSSCGGRVLVFFEGCDTPLEHVLQVGSIIKCSVSQPLRLLALACKGVMIEFPLHLMLKACKNPL